MVEDSQRAQDQTEWRRVILAAAYAVSGQKGTLRRRKTFKNNFIMDTSTQFNIPQKVTDIFLPTHLLIR